MRGMEQVLAFISHLQITELLIKGMEHDGSLAIGAADILYPLNADVCTRPQTCVSGNSR